MHKSELAAVLPEAIPIAYLMVPNSKILILSIKL